MTQRYYVLSYVNLEDETVDYDKEFPSLASIEEFIDREHPSHTSYQIIAGLGGAGMGREVMTARLSHLACEGIVAFALIVAAAWVLT